MNTTPKAFLTIGLIGSGKSTFSKRMLTWHDGSIVIVSRDSLRSMIYGGIYDYNISYEPVIKDMALSCAYSALNAGVSVIVDETCFLKRSREYWVSNIKQAGYEVVFLYFPENGKNLDYRMLDARGYSKEYWLGVIGNMQKSFEIPAQDGSEGELASYTISNPFQKIPAFYSV